MPEQLVEGLVHIADERKDASLRDPAHPLRPSRPGGIYIPRRTWVELQLRPGMLIEAEVRGKQTGKITRIEGTPLPEWQPRHAIYDATALDPAPQIKLEHNPQEFTTRIMDLLTPIGFGQRGLIVAPPRTGKTILLQNLARGIHLNHPNAELVLLLVDERPEEVTDMKRNVPGTLFASSNDNTIEKHLDLSQLVIERCKRRAEMGKDVIVLLDSLTRLGRAFNSDSRSGKTLSGGVDSRALEVPKRLFGAARKIEEGGSLTIIGTALVDTGSRMDEVIFEEFKGTGNCEIHLDRRLYEKRVFPAIHLNRSGTRKEELLLAPEILQKSRILRQFMYNMDEIESMELMLKNMKATKNNHEFFDLMRRGG